MGMYDRDWYRDRYRRKPEPAGTAFKAGDKLPGDGKSKPKAEKPRKSERISGLKNSAQNREVSKTNTVKFITTQRSFGVVKMDFYMEFSPLISRTG